MPLRNHIHRRQHKERGQLTHRKKLGLLEKHKDYVQRAKDHHSKRDRIKRLRQKALLEKNKDEFYFGMVKGRVEKGVHYSSRGNEAIPTSVVSLMKSQDAAYIRRQLVAETKRIERLVEELAPNIADMTIDWLKEKPKRWQALKEAGLVGQKSRGKRSRDFEGEESDDEVQRKVGSQGKRTVWVDDSADIRSYSAAGPSSATLASQPPPPTAVFRTSEDLEEDLQDLDTGEFLDDDGLADAEALFAEEEEQGDSAVALTQKALQRRRQRHLSYLLTLLSARQARRRALSSAFEHLSTVTALMNSKGSSIKKKAPNETKDKMVDAIAQGKLSKHGLAMPGNEDDDDDDEGDGSVINGSRKKPRAIWKFGRERKR